MPLKGRDSKNEIRHPENMSKNPRFHFLLLMRTRMLELTNTSENPNLGSLGTHLVCKCFGA